LKSSGLIQISRHFPNADLDHRKKVERDPTTFVLLVGFRKMQVERCRGKIHAHGVAQENPAVAATVMALVRNEAQSEMTRTYGKLFANANVRSLDEERDSV
jgi:hypothetical protein